MMIELQSRLTVLMFRLGIDLTTIPIFLKFLNVLLKFGLNIKCKKYVSMKIHLVGSALKISMIYLIN